jgi:Tfp pilus assembly protein PilF
MRIGFLLLLSMVLCRCQGTQPEVTFRNLDERLAYTEKQYRSDQKNKENKKAYLEALVLHCDSLKEEGDFKKAFEEAAIAFRIDSNYFDARMMYADMLNNRPERSFEDIAVAQRHFKILKKKKPKNCRVLVALATTYAQQMDFDQAFQYINQALRIDPKYRDAYVLKGSIYYKFLNKPDLAKSSYETAVQQDPSFYEGYLMLGALYQAESNPICLEYYRTAVQLRPKDPEVMFSLAYAYQVFDQPGSALSLYRKMLKIDNGFVQALNQIGVIKQYNYKQLDSAIYYYKSAVSSNEKFVEAWHNLGMCYEQKNDLTRALQSYAKALKYNPQFTLSRERADILKYER